jgi:hypothetical protein
LSGTRTLRLATLFIKKASIHNATANDAKHPTVGTGLVKPFDKGSKRTAATCKTELPVNNPAVTSLIVSLALAKLAGTQSRLQ